VSLIGKQMHEPLADKSSSAKYEYFHEKPLQLYDAQRVRRTITEFRGRFTMIKLCSLMLVVSLFLTSPVFAQDIHRAQLQQITKIEPVHASYLLPPQGQAATATTPKPTGTSHKKRNIIIAVVVAAVVTGVIVAANNGAYGSSSNTGTGY